MTTLWWMQAALTAVEIGGAFWFVKSLFHLKERNEWCKGILAVGCAALIALTIYQRSFFMYSRFYLIFSIVCISLLGSICLKGRKCEIWLSMAFYFETMYCMDLFLYIVANVFWPGKDFLNEVHLHLGIERIIIYSISRVAMAGFVVLVIRKNQEICNLFFLNRWLWVVLLVAEHSSLYACDIVLFTEKETAGIRNLKIVLLLCPLLIMSLAFLMVWQQYKALYGRLEIQNQLYAREYEANRKNMLKKERIYHDMKNHLLLLQRLMKEKQFKQAESYVDSLLEPMITGTVKKQMGQPLLDYLLLEKEAAAKEQGITVTKELNDVFLQIGEEKLADWCALLGNLWDNAIEGCKRADDVQKWIHFTVKQSGNALAIRMENSCDPVKLRRGLATVKEDKEHHGIGMKSIRYVVSKYGGKLDWGCKDGVFQIEVVLIL